MFIGNTEIKKEDMPSYEIGKDYPTRRYFFMQDTLNGALQRQQQMSAGQPVQTQPNGAVANQPSQWSNNNG